MKYQFKAEDIRKILHSEVVFGGDVDARDGETWKIQVDTHVLPSVHYYRSGWHRREIEWVINFLAHFLTPSHEAINLRI